MSRSVSLEIAIPDKLIPIFQGEADVRSSCGGRGSAKCLGKGTLLLKHDASLVAVEDVKIGDSLLGPDGKPRKVLSTAQGIGPLYQVTQTTGMPYIVNDAHILVLERSESSRKDYGSFSAAGNPQRPNGRYSAYDTGKGYSLITVQEYHQKPERFKAQHYGFRREIVGVHKALPVDPYLLGVWLGDGSSKAPEITNIDPEIIEFLHEISAENSWAVKKQVSGTKTPRYYLATNYKRAGSFIKQLRDSGVYRNKHIPECYFGASVEQRLALLAGIVDTDGHVSTGCITIAQSREHLLDDIVRLAHGLGLKASKRHKQTKSNGRLCDNWRAQIGGDIDRLPLKIERKRKASQVTKNKDWKRTRVDVRPIGIGAYYGFELDGDHLFMLSDGTVTHNTRSFAKMAAVVGLRYGQAGIKGQVLCARQFMNSLDESSLEECKRAIEDEPILTAYYEIGDKYIKSKDGNIGFTFAGLDRNIDSIKSKGRILLCWVDEAEPVTDDAWNTLIPTLREEGDDWNAELWVTWNSKRKNAPVERRFRHSDDPRVKFVFMHYTDNPKFPAVLERARLRDLQENPEDYGHIWDGDYKTHYEGAYYTRELILAKQQKRITRVPEDPYMAVNIFTDIGGTGAKSDNFVFIPAQFINREIAVLNHYEVQGQSLGYHLDWLRENNYTPARCIIWLPHDGETNDRVFAVSYESALKKAGYQVRIVPNQGRGAAKMRIEAAKRHFSAIYFNELLTEDLRSALARYHEKQDDKRNIGLGPEHDDASHSADAFGMLCLVYEDYLSKQRKPPRTATVQPFTPSVPGMGY